MKTWILLFTLLLVTASTVCAQTQSSDTMLVPRGHEAYEQHLAELNAKYGADKDTSSLKETVLKANDRPPQSQPGPGTSRLEIPADVAPGQKLRIELLPQGERDFLFQDQVYDYTSLAAALGNVQRGYVIEQVVLLTENDHTIQLDHLLELGRIGRSLGVPTSYQQGNELKLITTE